MDHVDKKDKEHRREQEFLVTVGTSLVVLRMLLLLLRVVVLLLSLLLHLDRLHDLHRTRRLLLLLLLLRVRVHRRRRRRVRRVGDHRVHQLLVVTPQFWLLLLLLLVLGNGILAVELSRQLLFTL